MPHEWPFHSGFSQSENMKKNSIDDRDEFLPRPDLAELLLKESTDFREQIEMLLIEQSGEDLQEFSSINGLREDEEFHQRTIETVQGLLKRQLLSSLGTFRHLKIDFSPNENEVPVITPEGRLNSEIADLITLPPCISNILRNRILMMLAKDLSEWVRKRGKDSQFEGLRLKNDRVYLDCRP